MKHVVDARRIRRRLFLKYSFISLIEHPEASRCLSCAHLDCQVCLKMSARARSVRICQMPLTKCLYENNVKFLCAIGRVACCIDGCLPLSYCKVCESVPVLSEGLSSKGVCISCLRCSVV